MACLLSHLTWFSPYLILSYRAVLEYCAWTSIFSEMQAHTLIHISQHLYGYSKKHMPNVTSSAARFINILILNSLFLYCLYIYSLQTAYGTHLASLVFKKSNF